MKKNTYLENLGKKALVASKSIVNLTEQTKNKTLKDERQECDAESVF